MITTAAADALGGLFAGAPATGDPAMASGVAFGRVLSASADMPVAPMTPPMFRTMPGIATLPIGTLMGTGSLPFQASNLPSALAWSGASVPVTTGAAMSPAGQPVAILLPTVANMPITYASLPAIVTDGSPTAALPASEEAGQPMPVIDGRLSTTTVPPPAASMPIKSSPAAVVTDGSPTAALPASEGAGQPMPVIDGRLSTTTVPPPAASMPIKSSPAAVVTDGSLTAVPPAIEPAGQRMPMIDGPSSLIAGDAPKAAIPMQATPGVEAPLPDMVTLDLPVPTEAEANLSAPTTDGREAPPPASAGKPERPTIAPARLAGSPVAPTSDTSTAYPADPEPAAPSEVTPATSPRGNIKRAEAKEKVPATLVATSVDPLAMPLPAPVLATMPSGPLGKPAIAGEGDDRMSSDDDRSDSADRKPVEGATSSGAVPLPAEMIVVPVKTVAVASEKPMAMVARGAHPAVVPPPQTDAASLAAIDTSKTAAANVATSTPPVGNVVREEAQVSETGAAKTQPASFANLITHTETTTAPAPTTPTTPGEPRVAVQPGRMGQEMGVAIARHAAAGGGEAMTVRLDPVEFGRIEVTLSFDDSGTIRAVVAAESPAALDLLRRDSADLGRSLAEAGIRSDAQSFRFDTRQGSADGSGQGGQRWQQQAATGTRAAVQTTDDSPEPAYRPLRTQGRVNLMA